MHTIAYILILAGILTMRATLSGRVREIPEDLRDSVVAVLTADGALLKEVGARKGGSASAGVVTLDTISYGDSSASGDLIAEMNRLAKAAGNDYHWGGASVKDGWDCSGLVYGALKTMGVYNGARFTTRTFESLAAPFAVRVATPQRGDIVVWVGSHMGVVTGTDRYYSALSERSGIKEDAIHNHKGTPHYWRLKRQG